MHWALLVVVSFCIFYLIYILLAFNFFVTHKFLKDIPNKNIFRSVSETAVTSLTIKLFENIQFREENHIYIIKNQSVSVEFGIGNYETSTDK